MKQTPVWKPQFFPALTCIAVLSLMLILFLAAQGADPARYNAPSETLQQMKALDAAVSEDAFELRFGVQNSCDALNDKMTALFQLRSHLEASLNTLGLKNSEALQRTLQRMDQEMASRQDQAEQFKTSNAVLANARYYFPSVCEFVRKHYAQNVAYPELTSELVTLEQDVLLHYMSGDPALHTASLAGIHRMQTKEGRLEPEARKDLHSLLLHAAMMVQSKDRVDTHLAALVAVASAPAYDAVSACLSQRRQAEFWTARNYRAALFLVGLLVFAYAIGAFLKTRRQARELHSANETLEVRVSERTQELQRAGAELQQSEQRFRAIFANASIGIGQLDLDGRLLQANAALCAILACGEAELQNAALSGFMANTDQERFRECLGAFQSLAHRSERSQTTPDNASCAAIRFVRADGSERWGQVRVSMVRAENDRPQFFILLVQDITAQKVAEQQIEQLAYFDSLTGLPNRDTFMIRLKEALERDRTEPHRIAILFVDCDNFKQVNDTLGHETGDEFLKRRAVCMQESLRPGDTLARFGGDEFAVLLEYLPEEEAALHIARRILTNLGEPVNLMGHEIFSGASIGIAFNQGEDVTAESMLRNADTAMYQIKTSSKGSYIVFEQGMNDRANEHLRSENGLRHALERGELRVHYQPLIDLETGQMKGTELWFAGNIRSGE